MRLALVSVLLLLPACNEAVYSEKPLVEGPGHRFKPGLWALIDEDCAKPKNARIFEWDMCAAPLLLTEGTITYFAPNRLSFDYRVSDGDPVIVQLAGAALDESPESPVGGRPMPRPRRSNELMYLYFAFNPGSPDPITSVSRIDWQLESTEAVGNAGDSNDADLQRRRVTSRSKRSESNRPCRKNEDGYCLATALTAIRHFAADHATHTSDHLIWIADKPVID